MYLKFKPAHLEVFHLTIDFAVFFQGGRAHDPAQKLLSILVSCGY